MRIAIHNQYAGQEVAETEFSQRICRAASNLGWEAIEVGSSTEVNRFHPDFVLALHFRTPKLTKYPTYGSMVTPPSFFAQDDQFVKNILSFDGYLSTSNHITSWLKDILYTTPKKYFITPFFTSCHNVPYRPPQIRHPRLLYAGTNWDGQRYKGLFQRLDTEPYLDVYGPKGPWSFLNHSYRGVVPFDGSSLLDALHKAGVGLCLHRQEHCAAAAPSSRIFEIAASGAIAICQEHPFIREAFGNSVLYLDPAIDIEKAAPQTLEYMRWIEENQKEALQLSKQAYTIFSENYTLEKLLSSIATCHEQLVTQKAFFSQAPQKIGDSNTVQFIVRVGNRGTEYVERALDSLAGQTEGRVGALIVRYGDVPGLIELLRGYVNKLPVEIVESPYTGSRSAQLWAGLKAVSSEYFGILDDDDVIHPNHVHSLLKLLEGSPNRGVAYSGSIRILESRHSKSELESPGQLPSEPAELAHFEPFDLNRLVALDNFITSNAFIARSTLLKDLGDDPQLPSLEDLFLLLYLCRKTSFVFSYEATCEFYWAGDRNENLVGLERVPDYERIRNILWKQSFHSAQSVTHNLPHLEHMLAHLEHKADELEHKADELEHKLDRKAAQLETILAQTNTRLEATTTRLDRYLKLPLVDAARRLRRKLLRLPS